MYRLSFPKRKVNPESRQFIELRHHSMQRKSKMMRLELRTEARRRNAITVIAYGSDLVGCNLVAQATSRLRSRDDAIAEGPGYELELRVHV